MCKGVVMRPNQLNLKDAIKHYQHDQDKVISPAQTVERFKQRLKDNHLDILKEVVRIDNRRLDIPVYFSICGPLASETIGNYKQMGKGATPDQAQASAVMELGERFSLFSFVKSERNYVLSPKRSLTEPCMEYSYLARSVSDPTEDPSVLEKFFDELPLKWTWAHDLTHNSSLLIPFNWFWTINEFNGSSAGNCNEEAICQGICEVVERHVSALISREQRKVPLIDLNSIHDPVACELIAKYRNQGIELYLSDFTLDMGIPSVGALAWDPNTFPRQSEIVWTAGTTPSATKALCRALTEVAQLAGDFNSSGNYVASGLPKFSNLEQARYITHPGRTIGVDALPEIGDINIKTEVENCLGALAERGMSVFVVDVTHPTLQIPAFYTVIPGAQFRERASHGSVGMIMAKIITQSHTPQKALDLLNQLGKLLPARYYLEFYIGQIHLEQSDFQTAATHFATALGLAPPSEDRATILTYLGLCHKETGEFKQAMVFLNEAHHIDMDRTDTLNLLGFCHFKLQAYEQAIDCFQRLIALDPSSAIDYANIGANYRAMGQKAKAIEYYQLALALDADIAFARAHLEEMGIPVDRQ
jgi:ribosomal protein S12 methylthiotransferase accessory factor